MSRDYQVTELPPNPTVHQVAEKVVEEIENIGYLVSFFDGDTLNSNQALLLLSKAVLGQDPEYGRRVTLQLEPERAQRLFEVLQSAGAHPSGLGSYEAAADALALREDLMAQVDR